MLTAHIKMIPKSNKKGFMGMIALMFFGLIALLILALIFKKSLLELFGAFGNIYKSRTFWIILILGLVVVFRKFVLEVLMMILKLFRGILHV
jgi:hypothetical protein